MKLTKGLVILLTFLVGLNCCKQENTYYSNDIKGVWVTITNDSIYDEIIITDNDFYTYDEHAGDLLLTYKLENDSLKVFYYGGLQSARKFKRINKDEFTEQDSLFTIKFKRLETHVDTSKVLSTKKTSGKDFDEIYYSKYINDLRQRRHIWDSLRNASR